jgi:cytochrome P450
LTDDEIMGNAFIFIIAGHETTASTLQYGLLSLALNPSSQRHLQRDLDRQFGKRPITSWDYETDVPALFGGMAGAVMNETLRCFPPAISIPKMATKDQPQTLMFQGKEVTVPASVKISLSAVATHQNPKYWPGDDPRQFRPERWLVDPPSAKKQGTVNGNTLGQVEDVDDTQGSGTTASLFKPPRGAYIPFSEGHRACLGRRFAQVEILAVLAVLFREYSIELAVDEWASDEKVDKMPVGGSERKEVWEKAAKRARWLMHEGSGTIITLRLRRGQVPIRWIRRGEERFAF